MIFSAFLNHRSRYILDNDHGGAVASRMSDAIWGSIMDGKEFAETVVSLGLVIRKDGRISDGMQTCYGTISEDCIIDPLGERILYEDVCSVYMSRVANALCVELGDGAEYALEASDMEQKPVNATSVTGSNVLWKDCEIPRTLAKLNDVFPYIFPNYKTQMYYDVLREQEVVDMALLGRPEEGHKDLDDHIISIYHDYLERKFEELGMTGKLPTQQIMDEALLMHIQDIRRNSFREWLESLVWDGRRRVRMWFRDVFGAIAPAYDTEKDELRYLGDVSEAWFKGAVARQYRNDVKHDIVPLIISTQGMGKGAGIRFSAGQDRWYIDTSNPLRPLPAFLDGIRGHVIVEFSEASQITGSSSQLFKSFISQTGDQLRKPYMRRQETFPRHCVFIATSNEDDILTDLTGNRRIFPMYCDVSKAKPCMISISREPLQQYEVEQLWAEALQMYKERPNEFLPAGGEDHAVKMQDYATAENPGVLAIDMFLDNPANGLTHLGARIDRKFIMETVFGWNAMFTSRECQEAFKDWTIATRSWRKTTNSKSIGGRPTKEFVRVAEPGGMARYDRLQISSPNRIDPEKLVVRLIERYDLHGFGDEIPLDELSSAQIAALDGSEYVYRDRDGTMRLSYDPRETDNEQEEATIPPGAGDGRDERTWPSPTMVRDGDR